MFLSLEKLSALIMSILLFFGSLFGWAPPTVTEPAAPAEVEMMQITQDYVIVKPQNATAVENTAAATLQNYLAQISGYTLAVVTDEAAYAKEILVGITNREGNVYTLDRASLGTDGVYLKTVGDTIVITGAAQRGVLYAVYTFLEDYLNCRWFTKDVTVIPSDPQLNVAKEIAYSHVPVLEYRETDWISPRDVNWSVANKLNGLVYRYLDENGGGGVGYAGSFAHTLQSIFTPDIYAQYPETRAFGIKSKAYTDEHPCLSNEKTYEIVRDTMLTWLAQNPGRQIVSITHPDNQDYCVCADCQAVYDVEGSPAGLMLRFVNRFADEIKDVYPDVKVDTFAYQYTRKPPQVTKPADNVIVRLCSIECCFVHALDDPDCKDNVDFAKDLVAWTKICKNLHIWDYTTNYSNFNGPFNNWAVMQPNMQFFMANNVIGIYEEGNYQAAESNGEFAELRSYLLAKLLWDCDVDVDRCMWEFCHAYYGAAAPEVLQYLALITKNSGKGIFGKMEHMGIFDNVANNGVMYMNVLDINYANELWEKAKAKDLTPEQLTRVRLSEISWRVWKSTKEVSEFNLLNRYHNNRKLYADMKELGITRIHEGGDNSLLAEKPYFMDPPGRWSKDRVPDLIPGLFY